MPLIKSAIKKLKQDKTKTKRNAAYKKNYKESTKNLSKSPTKKNLASAFKALDKAAKRGVIHKKKAARLKSHSAKLIKK